MYTRMENPELPFWLDYPLARAHVHVAENRLEQVVDKAIERRDSETGKDHHRYQREQDRLTIERLEREKQEATQRLGECSRNRRATSEQLEQSQRELADAEQRLGNSKRHREADMQNLVSLRRQVGKDESTISGLKSAASQSAERADMARAEFEQCRASKAVAQESLGQKERELESCIAESEQLKRLGKNLRASMKADKDALLESKAEVARLQSQTNTFRDKYKSCEETVADNKKAAEALQTELVAKQEEIETLVREAGGHGTDLLKLRQEMSQLEAKCDETVAALLQSKLEHKRCRTQLVEVKTSLRDARARQATLEELNRNHVNDIKKVKAREEELAQQLDECSRNRRATSEQLGQRQIDLDGARRTVAGLKRDREADMRNLVELRRQAGNDKAVALAELERCRTSKEAAEQSLKDTIAEREEFEHLNDNLRESIEKDKAALQETKLEVARLQRECTEFREKYNACKAEKEAMDDAAADTQRAVEDLHAQLVNKQTEIDIGAEQHGTISSKLKQEVSELRARSDQTIADLDQSRRNATESANALALCREQLVEAETRLREARSRQATLEELNRNHEKTIKKVKAREKELDKELSECSQREQTAVEQLVQREREVAELKRDREADLQNLVELRRQAIKDEAAIFGLEGEARRSAERAAEALENLEKCRASEEAANTSLAEKEGELKACIAERDEANRLAGELRDSIQARETTILNLEERIDDLRQQLTELRGAHASTTAALKLRTDELEKLKTELVKARADEAELRALMAQQQQTIEECEMRAKKAEEELETVKQENEATKTSMLEKTQLLETALGNLEKCKTEKDKFYYDVINTRQLANAVLTETSDESFEIILNRIGEAHSAFKDHMIALRKKIKDLRARLATKDARVSELEAELRTCQDEAIKERERLEGERDVAMKKLEDESNDVQVMIEMAAEVVDNFESADEAVIDKLGERLQLDRSSFVNRMKSLRKKIGEHLFDMHGRDFISAAALEDCDGKLKLALAQVVALQQKVINTRNEMDGIHLHLVASHKRELAGIQEQHKLVCDEKDKSIKSLMDKVTVLEDAALALQNEYNKQSAKLQELEIELADERLQKQQGLKREDRIIAERDACLASKTLMEAKIRLMGDQVDLLQAARQLFTQTLDLQQQAERDSLLPGIRDLMSRVEEARTNDDTLDEVLGSLAQLEQDLVSVPTPRGVTRLEEEDTNKTIERLMHRSQRDGTVTNDLQTHVTKFRDQMHESYRQLQQVMRQRADLKKEFSEILKEFDRGVGKRVKRSAFDLGKLFVWM